MWIRSTWPDRLCVKFESLWVLLACVGLVALLSQLAWSKMSVCCDYIGLGEGSGDVLTFLHFSWAPGPPRWDSVGTWSPQNNSSSSRAPRCLTHSWRGLDLSFAIANTTISPPRLGLDLCNIAIIKSFWLIIFCILTIHHLSCRSCMVSAWFSHISR